MSIFLFLTVIQAIVAAALVGIVLMQRSEGGGLGIGGGGSPGGLMNARGAADFLTRTTKWLAVIFVTLAIALAYLAVLVGAHRPRIDVEIGVELANPDLVAARLQERGEACRHQSLAKR